MSRSTVRRPTEDAALRRVGNRTRRVAGKYLREQLLAARDFAGLRLLGLI